jgi:flavin reductase (DIM6/NTAB) family NADH-FMN oxidoreductase RutF
MTAVTAAEYRELMTAFPTGVAVVTGLDGRGTPHGMTCTSLTSVTVDPPALLVCLNVRSGTLVAVRETGHFGVNLLHRHARRAARVFASAEPHRFGVVPWRATVATGVPWLTEDAFALAECRVSGSFTAGDHEVVVGEVVAACRRYEVPLLYGMRQFADWSGPVIADPAVLADPVAIAEPAVIVEPAVSSRPEPSPPLAAPPPAAVTSGH